MIEPIGHLQVTGYRKPRTPIWLAAQVAFAALLVVSPGCRRPESATEPKALTADDAPKALSPDEARTEAGRWLSRAVEYANKVPPNEAGTLNLEVFGGWITFAFTAISYGDPQRAIDEVAQIKNPKDREALSLAVIRHLAFSGDAARALDLVNTLPAGIQQQHGLLAMARGQSSVFRFKDAERTAGMMTDPAVVSAAWWHIGDYQIDAGQLDAAEASLAKVVAKDKYDQQARQDFLDRLAKARRGELPRRRPLVISSMADSGRRTAGSMPEAPAIPSNPGQAEVE